MFRKIENAIGSLKFAVVILSVFTICMIAGTFLESYLGADFANRALYKTFPFMLVQFFMCLSILFAATRRLPLKKRLYGFYVIHAGLLIIGIGSAITYIAGIDGQMNLSVNDSRREVELNSDILRIRLGEKGEKVEDVKLPFSFKEENLNQELRYIKLKKYLPFAKMKTVWSPPINHYKIGETYQSSQYFFKNVFAKETVIFSLHPEAINDFPDRLTMGPLSFRYLPKTVFECFREKMNKFVVWNHTTNTCRGIQMKVQLSDVSPDEEIFDKSELSQSPFLALFGDRGIYFDKFKNEWQELAFEKLNSAYSLPWMGAEISLIQNDNQLLPTNYPESVLPIQKRGQLISGDTKAVLIEIFGKEYWVSNYYPLGLRINNQDVILSLEKEKVVLPFEISLSKFKMDSDPGTNNPASYESFVKIFQNGEMKKAHIYMNNPLKLNGYTFYQASYSDNQDGTYNSTLAVNVDQGRGLKYFGSLMLVFGSIWHFLLNKRKK